jgi:uncharacterized protein (DUF58 family)
MSAVMRYLDPGLVERLNQLQLSARSVVEGATAGLHRSPVKGASVEFRQHRFYVPGDEPRRLDWRVLGRTDRPYVREYHEETNLRAVLMLDCSGSMLYGDARLGTKLDYARRIVASLAYLMLGQTESVGAALFSHQVQQWLPPQSHTAQLARVLELLDRAAGAGKSDVAAAIHAVADRLGRRALVIVVSDLLHPIEQIRRGLARLRHDRHEVILLRVLHPDEQQFPFHRFTLFESLEAERPILADASLLRSIYLRNFTRHQQQLEQACRAMRVELARFLTDQPLDEALVSFLRRRATAS